MINGNLSNFVNQEPRGNTVSKRLVTTELE